MVNYSPADLDASLQSTALDFDWGDRRGSGVVFQRQNARVEAIIAAEADAEAGTDGGGNNCNDANVPRNNMRVTAVDTHGEVIMLPQSTHSLLFTEKVCSIPFGFAFVVLVVSFTCLGLALWDGLSGRVPGNPLNVPVNVSHQVRISQYLAILIALTMEEEIPTGTYLLRHIPRSAVEDKLGLDYGKFVVSALFRLLIGEIT